MTAMEQFIFKQEMAAAGAPAVGGGGVQMLGPAMLVHGSEDQKREYLPKILSGEVGWAQGFSEPGAGSDLGSLQTRAARDGDEYVVNGQKIWTSGAHDADWIFMLARTDPDAPKHRGISMLLFDIHTPGVSVRPLISAGWQHDLNETFFEDVRVPAGQILGEENRGWYVAMTLLDFERSNIAGAVEARKELDEVSCRTASISPVTSSPSATSSPRCCSTSPSASSRCSTRAWSRTPRPPSRRSSAPTSRSRSRGR
jgi:alkylation response protein AidB-like acyl-CoA dehydrogenase